jgi:hypothetical protein
MYGGQGFNAKACEFANRYIEIFAKPLANDSVFSFSQLNLIFNFFR